MATAIERRRSRFLKALATAGMNQAAWARANSVSKAHLHYVLAGKRDSITLWKKIEQFAQEHLTKSTALAG